MSFTTNKKLNSKKEPGCFSITAERKYYELDDVFIKRSLRPHEWQITLRGTIHVPKIAKERLMNEAAALRFVRQHTDIPVPRIYSCFEDDEAVYLIQERIQGVNMNTLDDSQKEVVKQQIRQHLATLHSLHSAKVGAPGKTNLVVPPYRALRDLLRDDWEFPVADSEMYVFCHNDLSQNNVIVNPDTLEINAIVDWEFAGVFPEWFEAPFFERPGPSAALPGELDDSARLVEFIQNESC